MGVDVASIAKAIRAVAPECFIIVDGIQHAAHGHLDIQSYGIDGYVISPYKMLPAWLWRGLKSERLSAAPTSN